MDNYKIKVKNEAESKEAQELFFELGYVWADTKCQTPMKFTTSCIYSGFEDGELCRDYYDENPDHQELTIPQLRDLVVLKRNDVKDATHRDKRDESIYLTSDKVIYYWQGEWCKSAINKSNDYENYIANSLTPITQPQDPALISGADVLRALADGKEVEGFSEENEEWIPIVYFSVQEVVNGLYKFRLKPQTIKVELELPKPFEPEEDCHVYILDDGKTDGYRRYSYEVHGDKGNTFIGIWRTEEEIKQVVEQLRKIRGTN
ncbi:hypothetical protein W9I_03245 [Acinetobacter nosocomialis Ab22222]|uniref:hypothetical protein n=1 Tax=Acinetobacter calcoaceticus/baumannii complex TaxID=909768 RepID=UPI00028D9D4C|nr:MULTISPECIES: hypothetical protein [Acinetobacter calcoaceticus/baumannii complex]EKF46097.1 hypothetical protein W9I_03245 [Acinetobacter nosocomialis Ab22222]EXS45575.1 hypothetical protein J660_2484 [Acinetobacter sp. 88816]EXS47580.1 hypothetical protein J660_0922 [Acinetobacter sp. 88816]EXS47807.1 hypothetical protein J660_0742 [Acinetobacter sp. 88816]